MFSQSQEAFYRQNQHLPQAHHFFQNSFSTIKSQHQTPPKVAQNIAPVQYIQYSNITPLKSNYTSQSPIKQRLFDRTQTRDLSAKHPTNQNALQHLKNIISIQQQQQTTKVPFKNTIQERINFNHQYFSPNETFKNNQPTQQLNNIQLNPRHNAYSIAQQLHFHRILHAQSSHTQISPLKHPVLTPQRDQDHLIVNKFENPIRCLPQEVIPQQISRFRSKSPYPVQQPQKLQRSKRQFENSEQYLNKTANQSIQDQINLIQQNNRKQTNVIWQEIFQNPQKYIKIGRVIGKGKFSNVHTALDNRSGCLFALKIIEKATIRKYKIDEPIANEIKIQSFITHPNIIKLYCYYADDNHLHLLMELASDGDLYKYAKQQQQGKIQEAEAANIVHQVALAIQELHSNQVIHRDIKPENIIRQFDTFKLSDLGCAVYNPNGTRKTFCGTLDYVSPELATGTQYSFEIDLWALGILAFELVTGEPPFYDPAYQTRDRTLQSIVECRVNFPENTKPEFRDFVIRLLQRDPQQRMQITNLIGHLWIQNHLKFEQPSIFL